MQVCRLSELKKSVRQGQDVMLAIDLEKLMLFGGLQRAKAGAPGGQEIQSFWYQGNAAGPPNIRRCMTLRVSEESK
ncbi:unnamed protein product [Toxocara canis]|uniref:DNA-binding protein n=1 Tax=Toxocara canis TaxID=6265 RepID=A0A183UY58_TOXCA|nr:unnamed protein product [Toxocara canis]